jgi:hypothetical protein
MGWCVCVCLCSGGGGKGLFVECNPCCFRTLPRGARHRKRLRRQQQRRRQQRRQRQQRQQQRWGILLPPAVFGTCGPLPCPFCPVLRPQAEEEERARKEAEAAAKKVRGEPVHSTFFVPAVAVAWELCAQVLCLVPSTHVPLPNPLWSRLRRSGHDRRQRPPQRRYYTVS